MNVTIVHTPVYAIIRLAVLFVVVFFSANS